MRLVRLIGLLGACLSCDLAIAHLPAPGSTDDHPSGTAPGGPIKPRISTAPGDHELVHYVSMEQNFETTAIFLGSRWSDAAYVGDRIDGLDLFYEGFDESSYSRAMLEYFPGVVDKPGKPALTIGYTGHVLDTSDVLEGTGLQRVATQICQDLQTGLIPSHRLLDWHYFSVFLDVKRPEQGACGINGIFTSCSLDGGVTRLPFFVSLVYDVGDDPDCRIRDTTGQHSDRLASLANQAARAIAEVHTDPQWNGWHDNSGNEIDDKCEWVFDVPFVTFGNLSRWRLQSLWSNLAFEAAEGSMNREGSPGCVSSPFVVNSPHS